MAEDFSQSITPSPISGTQTSQSGFQNVNLSNNQLGNSITPSQSYNLQYSTSNDPSFQLQPTIVKSVSYHSDMYSCNEQTVCDFSTNNIPLNFPPPIEASPHFLHAELSPGLTDNMTDINLSPITGKQIKGWTTSHPSNLNINIQGDFLSVPRVPTNDGFLLDPNKISTSFSGVDYQSSSKLITDFTGIEKLTPEMIMIRPPPPPPPQLQSQSLSLSQEHAPTEYKVLELKKTEVDIDSVVLRKQVGQGATGLVYKGTLDGEEVAIKHFSENCISFSLETFMQEISILSQLRHPNIIKFYGACTTDRDKFYLITEYLPFSVDRMVSEKKVLELSSSLAYGISTARGMDYMHSVGFAHLDLKPGNLMIGKDELIRIIDFGSAQIIAKGITGNHGTMQYTAPEIFRKETYFERVDVFSFGVTLNELITGIIPYDGTESYAVPELVMKGTRPRLLETEDHSTVQVIKLIQRCWAQKASKRPSFTEIVFELSKILGGHGSTLGLAQTDSQLITVNPKNGLEFGMANKEWPINTELIDRFDITNNTKDSIKYEIQIVPENSKLVFQCSLSGTVGKKQSKTVKVKLTVIGNVNANTKILLHIKGYGTFALPIRVRSDIGFFGVEPKTLKTCTDDSIVVPSLLCHLKANFFDGKGPKMQNLFTTELNSNDVQNFRVNLREAAKNPNLPLASTLFNVSPAILFLCFRSFYEELPNTLVNSVEELNESADYTHSNPLLEYALRFFAALYTFSSENSLTLEALCSACNNMFLTLPSTNEIMPKLITQRIASAKTFLTSHRMIKGIVSSRVAPQKSVFVMPQETSFNPNTGHTRPPTVGPNQPSTRVPQPGWSYLTTKPMQ